MPFASDHAVGTGEPSQLDSNRAHYPRLVALTLRSRIEHASHPVMERVNALPRAVAFIVLGLVLVVGVAAPAPWSGIAFLLVSIFVGWLLYLTWPRLTLPERLMRVAVLVLALGVAIVNLFPRG